MEFMLIPSFALRQPKPIRAMTHPGYSYWTGRKKFQPLRFRRIVAESAPPPFLALGVAHGIG
jgi:hypothetical protein